MPLSGNLALTLSAALGKAADMTTPTADYRRSIVAWTIANGTGAGQANQIFADTRATDATGESLDLAGGLTNDLGATVTLATVKALIVKASAANTVDVHVGGAATNAFLGWVAAATDKVVLRPGATLCLASPVAGYALTGGTADLLKVAAGAAGSVSYDVIIIGTE